MMITSDQYLSLASTLYQLITAEMADYHQATTQGRAAPDRLAIEKFETMYQFFRYIRGESFYASRPSTASFQHQLYEWENNIRQQLETIKSHSS